MIEFGIKDIIDIVLVALLLYYIYRLMKASSAATIFSGILVFIVVWILVSQVFEMRLMGGILDKMVNMGGLALIILFQEEIRRFFSSIGMRHRANRLYRLLFHRKKDETFSHEDFMPLIMACMSMSKQKVGALIVIERTIGLNDVMHSGDIINADINQRLIENIFFKNSPLHDGALIISQKKLKAAGCILPVSHSSDIPKALGLRHRAALGISQKCDCLAIIISEETGDISTARDGHFKLRLSPEELESAVADCWRL
jgi:uncharacterized protein (TIGR00159 family)